MVAYLCNLSFIFELIFKLLLVLANFEPLHELLDIFGNALAASRNDDQGLGSGQKLDLELEWLRLVLAELASLFLDELSMVVKVVLEDLSEVLFKV